MPLTVLDHADVERGRDDKLRSRVHGPAALGEVQNGPGADREVIPDVGDKLTDEVQGPRHRQSDLDRAYAAAAQSAARVHDTVRRRNPDDSDDPRCCSRPSAAFIRRPQGGTRGAVVAPHDRVIGPSGLGAELLAPAELTPHITEVERRPGGLVRREVRHVGVPGDLPQGDPLTSAAIRIGTYGCWTGRTRSAASFTWRYLPVNVNGSPRHRPRTIWSVSSIVSCRIAVDGIGTHICANSGASQPDPIPRTTLPSLSLSTSAACRASRYGLR